jgi:hypothetical protein
MRFNPRIVRRIIQFRVCYQGKSRNRIDLVTKSPVAKGTHSKKRLPKKEGKINWGTRIRT